MDLVCKKYKTFLGTEILFFIRQCPLKYMSGNKWWSTKVDAKLLSDLIIFSIYISFWHSIRFPRISLRCTTKIFNAFFSWYKHYIMLKYSWKKHFAPLRILNLFIKSFVNSFVDISLTFSDSSFNSFSTSACFVSFEVTFLYIFFSLRTIH